MDHAKLYRECLVFPKFGYQILSSVQVLGQWKAEASQNGKAPVSIANLQL